MAITKADFRSALANLIDDPNNLFWSSTNIDAMITMTADEKWADILTFAPFYRSTLETITGTPKLTAAGAIDLTQLANRFFRLQSIVRDGRTYEELNAKSLQMNSGAVIVGPDFHYTFFGDLLYLFPISASQSLEMRYSSLPVAFSSLASNDPITWPDGSESALLYECAARATMKGGREDNAMFINMAAKAWDTLLSKIKRRNMPLVPFDMKMPQDFGGI